MKRLLVQRKRRLIRSMSRRKEVWLQLRQVIPLINQVTQLLTDNLYFLV